MTGGATLPLKIHDLRTHAPAECSLNACDDSCRIHCFLFYLGEEASAPGLRWWLPPLCSFLPADSLFRWMPEAIRCPRTHPCSVCQLTSALLLSQRMHIQWKFMNQLQPSTILLINGSESLCLQHYFISREFKIIYFVQLSYSPFQHHWNLRSRSRSSEWELKCNVQYRLSSH